MKGIKRVLRFISLWVGKLTRFFASDSFIISFPFVAFAFIALFFRNTFNIVIFAIWILVVVSKIVENEKHTF